MKWHRKTAIRILFVAYCVLMVQLLFFRAPSSCVMPYWQIIRENINIIPFATIRDQIRIILHKETLRSYFDEETNELLDRGVNPIGFDGLHLSVTRDDSKKINADPVPKVIISASGMCEAGRIRHHLKHNLWRPECTVLFVGYQVEGTLGRRLLDGVRYVNLFGEDVKVSADIENLEGISAHADMYQLTDWIASMKKRPKRVYVNHGSDGICDSFAKTVTERLGIEATAPYSGDAFDPIIGAQLAVGSRKRCRTAIMKERGAPLQYGANCTPPVCVLWELLTIAVDAGVRS